jgi:hypothetical protein
MPESVYGLPSSRLSYTSVVRRTPGLVLFWPALGGAVLSSVNNFVMPARHTMECWAKWTSVAGNAGIFSNWAGIQGTMLWVNVGNVVAMHYDNSDMSFGLTPGTGTWYHLVGTYDGTNRATYLQGQLVSGPTAQAAPSAVSTPLVTRNYVNSGNAGMSGSVGDGAIYARALSASEIQAHWLAGMSVQH